MSKGDSKKTIDGSQHGECETCVSDQSQSEEGLPWRECRKCSAEHLEKNMFQKVPGWLCWHCANEYEQSLMKATA
jgi:hypothetical protein